MGNKILCGRTDCIHNDYKSGCYLKQVSIGKDLTCQSYHRSSDKERNENFDKTVMSMQRFAWIKAYEENGKLDKVKTQQDVFQPVPVPMREQL